MVFKIGALLISVQTYTILSLKPCVCPLDYKPVCGTNTVTYMNECRLKCARKETATNIVKLLDRPCSMCQCGHTYRPICGTDNVTHDNMCTLECARQDNPKLIISFEGECELGIDSRELAEKPHFAIFV